MKSLYYFSRWCRNTGGTSSLRDNIFARAQAGQRPFEDTVTLVKNGLKLARE